MKNASTTIKLLNHLDVLSVKRSALRVKLVLALGFRR